jgi:type IV pilus assembly protein PilW
MYQPFSRKLPAGYLRGTRQQRGMGLPEILAGVLIGLIGMVVIMQVYTISEERKRTTTGTSDAQINGSIALYTLEREIRSAGFGIVSPNNNMLGCLTRVYNNTRPTTDFKVLMAPVLIIPGGTTYNQNTGLITGAEDLSPDRIAVVYGNSPNLVEGTAFNMGALADADIPLKNAGGIRPGDLVVASESGSECSMVEITGFLPGTEHTVQHVVGAYNYLIGTVPVNAIARYNKPGGLGVDYSGAARLFTLGRSPTVTTYQIGSDKLQSRTLIPYIPALDSDNDGTSDSDIGDGIVQLQAQYGKDRVPDANGDGVGDDNVVDTWNTVLPTNVAEWRQVRALRIALLARSGQYEKTVVTPDCVAPGNPPNSAYWSGGCFQMSDPDLSTNWRQYRYRSYETVVPIRNMIWSN